MASARCQALLSEWAHSITLIPLRLTPKDLNKDLHVPVPAWPGWAAASPAQALTDTRRWQRRVAMVGERGEGLTCSSRTNGSPRRIRPDGGLRPRATRERDKLAQQTPGHLSGARVVKPQLTRSR